MSVMSEEEKKAIEDLKKLKMGIEYLNLIVRVKDEVDIKAIDIILNLLEKQQKEIEELTRLKNIYKNTRPIGEVFHDLLKEKEYINKDKIREKIKEYDKWIKQGDYTESLEAQKYALEELLEENNARV